MAAPPRHIVGLNPRQSLALHQLVFRGKAVRRVGTRYAIAGSPHCFGRPTFAALVERGLAEESGDTIAATVRGESAARAAMARYVVAPPRRPVSKPALEALSLKRPWAWVLLRASERAQPMSGVPDIGHSGIDRP
ncbi:MAG: hypothetical protein VW405_01275 [Rhodospirillaceae bacterium]